MAALWVKPEDNGEDFLPPGDSYATFTTASFKQSVSYEVCSNYQVIKGTGDFFNLSRLSLNMLIKLPFPSLNRFITAEESKTSPV